ncbi:hypothetical protein [Mucilaginibacter terrae]|uniref:Uncharacterized protein HemX n=1 Tax=Mucilaginibacter terrae TaxID=1955052 RepID=A0ABU3GXZ1_9SPHI|nr:hypothetical protein [Mucilaginibacter terrae]MDT3404644.1 uncharacterized protein HemX [Mucilaginibacter terrae]
MKNRHIACALALALSVTNIAVSSAQDSAKKSKPTITKPVYKPKPAGAYVAKPAANNPYAAQQPVAAAAVNTDKSLNGQYQYLSSKVYNYQKPPLTAFYKNVTDTLRAERKKVKELQAKIAEQGKTVQNLQSDVSTKEQSLSESNSKVDAISLLGMSVSKSAYNSIMWGLVIVFGAVAAIVIFQSGSARREAKYRIKLYEELDEEYKAYKAKANEKEKKLARELQTERNKLDELMGRA